VVVRLGTTPNTRKEGTKPSGPARSFMVLFAMLKVVSGSSPLHSECILWYMWYSEPGRGKGVRL
jgi:hypothetical protein